MRTEIRNSSASFSRRGFVSIGIATATAGAAGAATSMVARVAAEPITDAFLDSYDAWLHFERRWLRWNRYGPEGFRRIGGAVFTDNPGGYFHDDPARTDAASRVAVILTLAGCDWRRA